MYLDGIDIAIEVIALRMLCLTIDDEYLIPPCCNPSIMCEETI